MSKLKRRRHWQPRQIFLRIQLSCPEFQNFYQFSWWAARHETKVLNERPFLDARELHKLLVFPTPCGRGRKSLVMTSVMAHAFRNRLGFMLEIGVHTLVCNIMSSFCESHPCSGGSMGRIVGTWQMGRKFASRHAADSKMVIGASQSHGEMTRQLKHFLTVAIWKSAVWRHVANVLGWLAPWPNFSQLASGHVHGSCECSIVIVNINATQSLSNGSSVKSVRSLNCCQHAHFFFEKDKQEVESGCLWRTACNRWNTFDWQFSLKKQGIKFQHVVNRLRNWMDRRKCKFGTHLSKWAENTHHCSKKRRDKF